MVEAVRVVRLRVRGGGIVVPFDDCRASARIGLVQVGVLWEWVLDILYTDFAGDVVRTDIFAGVINQPR